ncbi:MAG: protein TolR [Sideroxydans sp.]|nr:protein TolR [Sideroxydans sp.]
MRTNRRNKNRLMNDINVVPYIDVMLVLLVIFMVTAPMMNPGQVDLPSLGNSALPAAAPLEVVIRKDTSLLLRDHANGDRELRVSRAEMMAFIKARTGRLSEQAVVIAADKNVRYEEVINVMDALQQQHIKKIGLLTQAKNK